MTLAKPGLLPKDAASEYHCNEGEGFQPEFGPLWAFSEENENSLDKNYAWNVHIIQL